MKTHFMKIAVISAFIVVNGSMVQGSTGADSKDLVKWIGTVQCQDYSNSSGHDHDVTFVRQSDQEDFSIVDSPDFAKTFCGKDKATLLEIEAQKTARFLFFGGNLIVKNYAVLQELEQTLVHSKAVQSVRVMGRGDR